jgi:hypothetical protein
MSRARADAGDLAVKNFMENRLSTRARNVLTAALWGPRGLATGSLTGPPNWWSAKLVASNTSRDALRHIAKRDGKSVVYLLRGAQGGGAVTCNELLRWLRLSSHAGAHTCVCRDCGRRMGDGR